MYYQISEDEFNSLESARDQLNLIAGLVACFNTKECLSAITGAELHAFVDAQQATVSRVIEAANERETQASAARREEAAAAKVQQVLIAPELLMGLMDAAFGKLTESEALNKLWDKLYDAGTMHRPYMDALHHFIDVMRDRGLVMYVQSLDGHSSRAFVPVEPASKPKDAAPAKPRKRERLARVGA